MTKKKSRDDNGLADAGAGDFHPFADDEAAVTIGGLTIENRVERISLSGSLDIAADKSGLEQAQALQKAAAAIVDALAAKGDLPEKATPEETNPAKRVRNPFA